MIYRITVLLGIGATSAYQIGMPLAGQRAVADTCLVTANSLIDVSTAAATRAGLVSMAAPAAEIPTHAAPVGDGGKKKKIFIRQEN